MYACNYQTQQKAVSTLRKHIIAAGLEYDNRRRPRRLSYRPYSRRQDDQR